MYINIEMRINMKHMHNKGTSKLESKGTHKKNKKESHDRQINRTGSRHTCHASSGPTS